MAIEDVAVMVRCIEAAGSWREAFAQFEATRKHRTSQMQAISAGNRFARTEKDEVDWVYGYDAWTTALGAR